VRYHLISTIHPEAHVGVSQPPTQSDDPGLGDEIALLRPFEECDVEIGRQGRYALSAERCDQSDIG